MPGQARWTALLAQAQWALLQVSSQMQEYYDERSEAWQESERGEDFAQRLEAVQEVLEAMAELDAADTKNPSKPLTDHLRCLVRQQLVGHGIILSYSACESIQNQSTPPSWSKPNAR